MKSKWQFSALILELKKNLIEENIKPKDNQIGTPLGSTNVDPPPGKNLGWKIAISVLKLN